MILQFGTSRFLQAHVDTFAWQARESGQTVPDIAIVQVSNDAARARRLPVFADPAGFPVIIRGLDAGRAIDERIMVRSVVMGLAALRDWPELISLFVDHVTHIVSNTGDAGFGVGLEDLAPHASNVAPTSFCGLLTELLHQRWRAGRPGLTILPCELIAANGETLRQSIVALATRQGRDAAFQAWLTRDCLWVNTLVDRIVSEPIDPAGAIAEPYALWAIERQPGLVMPFAHPAIVLTDDLAPFERLKLHILNLGHTWLAERWRTAGAPAGMTVRGAMSDPTSRDALEDLYAQEVLPGFAARSMADDAARYIATTLDRFANPFLDHPLADIAVAHRAKIAKRIGGFIDWVDASGVVVAMPYLRTMTRVVEPVA